jgi:hypothetical protein
MRIVHARLTYSKEVWTEFTIDTLLMTLVKQIKLEGENYIPQGFQ